MLVPLENKKRIAMCALYFLNYFDFAVKRAATENPSGDPTSSKKYNTPDGMENKHSKRGK